MQNLVNIDGILLSQIRQTYVKIELLNKDERTIDSVEGETTTGNISIDGSSSVRRVANISFVITKGNYKILETSNKISLNKKIRILIGIKTSSRKEPHWFNCGIYILFKANVSVTVSSNLINLIAHDKMCLHNGTVSGKISYNTRVDAEYQVQPYNNAIATIEANMEQINKIFEDRTGASIATQIAAIKAQLTHIYTYVQEVDYPQEVLVFKMKQQCDELLSETDDGEKRSKFKKLQDNTASLSNGSKYHKLLIRDIIKYTAISLAGEIPGKVIINDVAEKVKTPIMIDASKNKIGYKMINYVYPSELTIKTGQPLTSIYDACVEALGGNFEYFYDTNGNFIFQEIKNYINNNIVPLEELKPINYKTSYNKIAVQYDFSENNLISAYANNPEWSNIKNDLFVWGSGKDYLYGYHLVIDDKPQIPEYVYDYIENKPIDWREYIIHNYNVGVNHAFVGKGKEVNLLNFTAIAQSMNQNTTLTPICCITDKNKAVVYKEYKNNAWSDINLATVTKGQEIPPYYGELSTIWFNDRYETNFMPKEKNLYTYNFDIIEGDRDLNKFSISSIGKRTEVVDDKDIKQLYPTIVEEVLVYYHDEDLEYTSNPATAIKVANLNDFEKYKPVGNIYKDAFSAIKNMLFKHTTFNEQITITSMPIYYLEPNRRAYVYSNAASIDGYYLIKKINFNFNDAGLMTINMIRA